MGKKVEFLQILHNISHDTNNLKINKRILYMKMGINKSGNSEYHKSNSHKMKETSEEKSQ